jgi:hypothetical protein
MLTVTKKAAALLKAAKAAEGATGGAGIRLRRGAITNDSEKLTVGFTISDEPDPDDEEFEPGRAPHFCGRGARRTARRSHTRCSRR